MNSICVSMSSNTIVEVHIIILVTFLKHFFSSLKLFNRMFLYSQKHFQANNVYNNMFDHQIQRIKYETVKIYFRVKMVHFQPFLQDFSLLLKHFLNVHS